MLFQKLGHGVGALGGPQHRLMVKEDNNVVHNFRAEISQKHELGVWNSKRQAVI